MSNFSKTILYLTLLLLISILGAVRFKKLTAPFKVVVFIIWTTMVSESIAFYLALTVKMSYPVYHFYVLVSFWLYSLAFQQLFKNRQVKVTVLFITIPFTIYSIINSLFVQPIKSFPSYSIQVSGLLLVIYCLFFFRQMLDRKPAEYMTSKGYFWLALAVLLFFASQLFNWGLYNYLTNHDLNTRILALFGYFMSILYYSCIGILLFVDSKNKQYADEYRGI